MSAFSCFVLFVLLLTSSADALGFTRLRLCYFYFGTIDDLGWTFTFNNGRVATHEALVSAFPQVEFESAYEPNVFFGVDNKTQLLLNYVATGCNVFITNNELLLGGPDADDWAARTFPNISFILLGPARLGNVDFPNRVYVDHDFSSPYYLAGAVAASQAKTCLGFTAAFEDSRNPNDAANGFILGARSVNATLPIEVVTMNSWYWPDAEVRAAELLLARGCEVIGHYSDPRDLDIAVGTYRSRTRANVLSVGPHSNLQQYVGDSVLIAVFEDWSRRLIPLLTSLVNTGTLDQSQVLLGKYFSGVLQTSVLSPLATRNAIAVFDDALLRLRATNENIFCGALPLRNGSVFHPSGSNGCATVNEHKFFYQFLQPGRVTFHPAFQNADSCPAGTSFSYSTTGLIQLTCTPCPENTYSATAASASCTPCPSGSQASQGAASCIPIPTSQSNSTGLVAGLVTAFCVLIIVLVVALLAVRLAARKRNQYAPREAPLCLMFTDVESSTTLWQNHPEEMAVAMETHHRVIREVLAEEEAYEVKTVGDSFMIATKTTADGLMVATKIQQRLHEAEWPSCFVHHTDSIRGLRVRIGLHLCRDVHVKFETGYYDYYGNDVNAAARIESQARGGQILIDQQSFVDARNDETYVNELEPEVVVRLFAMNVSLKGIEETYTLLSVVHRTHAAREFAPLEGHEKDQNGDLETAISSDTFSDASSTASATGSISRRVLAAQLQPLAPAERHAILKQLCSAHGVLVAGRGGNYRKTVAALARVIDGTLVTKTPRHEAAGASPKDENSLPPHVPSTSTV